MGTSKEIARGRELAARLSAMATKDHQKACVALIELSAEDTNCLEEYLMHRLDKLETEDADKFLEVSTMIFPDGVHLHDDENALYWEGGIPRDIVKRDLH